MIALCSILSDTDAFTDMAAFAKSQMARLRTFLPLLSGAPSHDVFRNVFIALRPQALLDILAGCCGDSGGRHVAIDGKALRGSDSAATGQSMIDFRRIAGVNSDFVMGHVRAGQEVTEAEIIAAGFEKTGEVKGFLLENYFVKFRRK